ncbi:unnamed protein product [Vicia faba]|uniref:Uncharacterized protein n=1 Tax=Vicia faba TaxID=3906 RepID=A0AAV0YV23_VICFA|nr:unnamed protein product [Vicia faba]
MRMREFQRVEEEERLKVVVARLKLTEDVKWLRFVDVTGPLLCYAHMLGNCFCNMFMESHRLSQGETMKMSYGAMNLVNSVNKLVKNSKNWYFCYAQFLTEFLIMNMAANTHELILDLISLSSGVSPCMT